MVYYNYNEIDKTTANYRIAIGERSNGKTYGFKKKMIDNFVDNGKESAYVRTLAENIKSGAMNLFFDDIYDYFEERLREKFPAYEHFTYIAKNDKWTIYGIERDNENTIKIVLGVIGYYFALTQGTKYKSVPYPNINLMAWDEFLTRDYEPKETFSKFINLVSTIKRKRDDFVVYMLGNTVTRSSSVLEDMNINLRDLRQGEIKLYLFESVNSNGERVQNTVAVEYCESVGQSVDSESFFVFNSPRELMIRNGAWETDAYSNINGEVPPQDYRIAARLIGEGIILYMYVSVNGSIYVLDKRLKEDNAGLPDYITLHSTTTNYSRRQFSMRSNSKFITFIKNIIVFNLQNDLILYSNNLVGDDFNKFLQESGII